MQTPVNRRAFPALKHKPVVGSPLHRLSTSMDAAAAAAATGSDASPGKTRPATKRIVRKEPFLRKFVWNALQFDRAVIELLQQGF